MSIVSHRESVFYNLIIRTEVDLAYITAIVDVNEIVAVPLQMR